VWTGPFDAPPFFLFFRCCSSPPFSSIDFFRQVGLFYSLNLRWMHNRYPNVNKEEWLTFSLIILCQKPGMDRNYCLIVFIVYMSYSDT
jgi:hypothetical protein